MTCTSITCVFALILIVEVFPVFQKKNFVWSSLCTLQCRADNRISSITADHHCIGLCSLLVFGIACYLLFYCLWNIEKFIYASYHTNIFVHFHFNEMYPAGVTMTGNSGRKWPFAFYQKVQKPPLPFQSIIFLWENTRSKISNTFQVIHYTDLCDHKNTKIAKFNFVNQSQEHTLFYWFSKNLLFNLVTETIYLGGSIRLTIGKEKDLSISKNPFIHSTICP